MDLTLDVATAAIATNVGASTIRRWVKSGVIEAVSTKPTKVRTDDVLQAYDAAKTRQRANLDLRHPREHSDDAN